MEHYSCLAVIGKIEVGDFVKIPELAAVGQSGTGVKEKKLILPEPHQLLLSPLLEPRICLFLSVLL
jgi:hypothetical protein